jgi:hypothetical protein
MAAKYLYQRQHIFDIYAVANVSFSIQNMTPVQHIIIHSHENYTNLVEPCSHIRKYTNVFSLVPAFKNPLLHSRAVYRSVADLELQLWIDMNSNHEIFDLSAQSH